MPPTSTRRCCSGHALNLLCLRWTALAILALAVPACGDEPRLDERDAMLIKDLASPSHAVREPAIEELAVQSPRTIPRLLAALRDPHRRLAAGRSLALIPDAEVSVVPQLIDMLQSSAEGIRTKTAVAETLKHLGPKGSKAVPVLIGMVERGGIDTRMRQRSPTENRDWSAQAALAGIGDAAVAPVAGLLSSERGQVCVDGLRILARIGRPALAAEAELLGALRHTSVHMRLATIRALRSIGVLTPGLQEALAEAALTDQEEAVRMEARDLLASAEIQR